MAGFSIFGIEERAIKVGTEYFAKAHMTIRLPSIQPATAIRRNHE